LPTCLTEPAGIVAVELISATRVCRICLGAVLSFNSHLRHLPAFLEPGRRRGIECQNGESIHLHFALSKINETH
jgi:hypothetical protein